VLKAYKYRIYPSEAQKQDLAKFFGGCRFVYNLGLETKIRAYTSAKKTLNCFDLNKQLTELKQTEAIWLNDCPSSALVMSLRNLDNAYTRFFKGGGFPKFKNRYSIQSIQFPQDVSVNGSFIRIPKIKLVPIVLHRPLGIGKIKTTTLTKTPTGKYFVSILIDNSVELPQKKPISEQTTVGIDLGIKDLAILSDSTTYENKHFFKKSKNNLRRQQRSLSRKKEGSKRREKQRLVVACVHEKIRNQRVDYLHKITTDIVKRFDTVCMEDLNVQGMMQNRKLSLAIAEIGWHSFLTMLKYKCDWYGKNFIQIGRFEPSSKICSNCGAINKELTLSVRNWDCKVCGVSHDRDQNAAKNIKNFGLRNKPTSVKTGH
jgi:putative transposase